MPTPDRALTRNINIALTRYVRDHQPLIKTHGRHFPTQFLHALARTEAAAQWADMSPAHIAPTIPDALAQTLHTEFSYALRLTPMCELSSRPMGHIMVPYLLVGKVMGALAEFEHLGTLAELVQTLQDAECEHLIRYGDTATGTVVESIEFEVIYLQGSHPLEGVSPVMFDLLTSHAPHAEHHPEVLPIRPCGGCAVRMLREHSYPITDESAWVEHDSALTLRDYASTTELSYDHEFFSHYSKELHLL